MRAGLVAVVMCVAASASAGRDAGAHPSTWLVSPDGRPILMDNDLVEMYVEQGYKRASLTDLEHADMNHLEPPRDDRGIEYLEWYIAAAVACAGLGYALRRWR